MMKYIILTINAIFCLLLPTACSGSGETGEKTPETVALLQNLKQAERKGILFGHHDDTAYGIGWEGDNPFPGNHRRYSCTSGQVFSESESQCIK